MIKVLAREHHRLFSRCSALHGLMLKGVADLVGHEMELLARVWHGVLAELPVFGPVHLVLRHQLVLDVVEG